MKVNEAEARIVSAKLDAQERRLTASQAVVEGLNRAIGLYQRQMESAPATDMSPAVTVHITDLSWKTRRRLRKEQSQA